MNKGLTTGLGRPAARSTSVELDTAAGAWPLGPTPSAEPKNNGSEWLSNWLVSGNTTKANFQSLTLTPIYLPRRRTILAANCRVTTLGAAGAVVRVGFYASDPTGRPGRLIADCGTVDATTTGVKSITGLNIPAGPGFIWATAVTQVATSTIMYATYNQFDVPAASNLNNQEVLSGPLCWMHTTALGGNSASAVTGALPATLTLGYNNNGGPAWTAAVAVQVA